ncbi:MAG: hypothetical protein QW540_09745 [Archaeoglobaceae archaeon]
MRNKKRKLIVVTYNFHPEEFFAEEVGKRIAEMNLEDVVVIDYRPECMPEHFKELLEMGLLSWDEHIQIDRKGIAELGEYLRTNFPDFGTHIDLHDTYYNDRNDLRFLVDIPSRNKPLARLMRQIKKIYGKKIDLQFKDYIPKGDSYRRIIIDFLFPKIEGEDHEYIHSRDFLKRKEVQELLDESVDFTLRFIGWIKRYYLNPSEGFYEVYRLFQ